MLRSKGSVLIVTELLIFEILSTATYARNLCTPAGVYNITQKNSANVTDLLFALSLSDGVSEAKESLFCLTSETNTTHPIHLRIAVPPGGKLLVNVKEKSVKELTALPPGIKEASSLSSTFLQTVEEGWFRYMRFIDLEITPWRRNPATGSIELLETALIQVQGGRTSSQAVHDPLALPLYRAVVVNDENIEQWLGIRGNLSSQRPLTKELKESGTGISPVFAISVSHSGLYRITYNDLLGEGLINPAYSPARFHLLDAQGRTVAMDFIGDDDNLIEPGEYFLFYGEEYHPPPSRYNEFQHGVYTNTNIYHLRVDGGNPGVSSVDGTPNRGYPSLPYFLDSRRYETNRWFFSGTPTGNDDHWFWLWLNWSTPEPERSLTLPLDGFDPSAVGEIVHLEIELMGITQDAGFNPDHHVQVWQNNGNPPQLLFDETFDGFTRYRVQGDFSLDKFVEGDNILRTDIVNDLGVPVDVVLLDWINVKYPRKLTALEGSLVLQVPSGNHRLLIENFRSPEITLFDITDPMQPVKITGGQVQQGSSGYSILVDYSTPTDATLIALDNDALRNIDSLKPLSPEGPPMNHYFDYLVITSNDLAKYPIVQQYLEHRQSQGLRTELVTVEEIMQAYSGGIFDPEAIHKFLQDLFMNTPPPAPLYILFIGDTTFDYLNYFGNTDYQPGTTPLVPTWIEELPATGESLIANDMLFTRVVGNDGIPDLIAGRISARTRRELGDILSKLIQYDSASGGEWEQTIMMVADMPRGGEENVFETVHDSMATTYLSDPAYNPFVVKKIYHRLCCPGDETLMHNALVNAWNEGAVVLTYAGHGGHEFWGYTPFLESTDPALLTEFQPLSSLPFTLNISCRTGAFHKSTYGKTFWDAFMETFTKLPSRGVSAALAPSAVDDVITVSNTVPLFYEALFSPSYRYRRTGDVAFYTWVRLLESGAQSAGQNLVLFGDPAMKLRIPSIDAPQNLTAVAGDYEIDLTWAPVPGALGYLIYRAPAANGPYTRITASHVVGTTFMDQGLVPGTTYYYRITAVNSRLFESPWSNTVWAIPLEPTPGPPQNLTVTDPALGNTLDLVWSPPLSGPIYGYRIRYGTSSGTYDRTIVLGNVTAFRVFGLVNGQTYFFIVEARNSLGQYGPASNEASGVPTRDGEIGFPIIFPLLLTKQGSNVVLQWPVVSDAGFLEYHVYRDVQKDLQRTPPNILCLWTDPNQTTCTDTGSASYYYQVTYLDGSGEHQ